MIGFVAVGPDHFVRPFADGFLGETIECSEETGQNDEYGCSTGTMRSGLIKFHFLPILVQQDPSVVEKPR